MRRGGDYGIYVNTIMLRQLTSKLTESVKYYSSGLESTLQLRHSIPSPVGVNSDLMRLIIEMYM